jgi:hypothetical protein
MAQVIKSTQGSRTSFGVQSSGFGTAFAGTPADWRPEDNPSISTPVEEGTEPLTVHGNPYDREKPITERRPMADAFTVKSYIRQATNAGSNPSIVSAMEAAGMVVVSEPDNTAAGTPTATEIDVQAATIGNYNSGYCANFELDDGSWVPGLVHSVSGDTIKLAMGLPSAPSSTNAINKCFSISPGEASQITAAKLLTVYHFNNTGDRIVGQDCAVTAINEMSLAPDEPITIEYVLGTSSLTKDETVLGSNNFADSTNAMIFHNPWCQFAAADSLGGITAAYHKVLSASIAFNATAEMVMGMGDANCVNNLQAWMQIADKAVLTVELLFDEDKIDDFEGTNGSKYISVIQPGQAETDPAFGFFMPNGHIVEKPEWDMSNNEHRLTVKYTGKPAGYSGTDAAAQGNQCWYLAIADRSA